jgi:hypothetical protein
MLESSTPCKRKKKSWGWIGKVLKLKTTSY